MAAAAPAVFAQSGTTFARAFGGQDDTKGVGNVAVEHRNLVGSGFHPYRQPDEVQGKPLPNLERHLRNLKAFGLPCVVYMGAVDVERQRLNVFRMQLLGATVVPVQSGSATLKDAINEALRDWVANVDDTHYVIGSVMGPDPYPTMVRELQRVIGSEAREQALARLGRLPDMVVACVGGGSNAMGIFSGFVGDAEVRLWGVEAAGEGLQGRHAATMSAGRLGIYHGMRSLVLQDDDGQLQEAHSISAGLDYPGVGPEHAWLHHTGRARYVSVTDDEALAGLRLLSRTEGIIPALETAHAVAALPRLCAEAPGSTVVLNVSGRGDKDMHTVMARADAGAGEGGA